MDSEPQMVGRENELNELEEYLERAIANEGNTIFISGEAGVGKTRLVNELKQIAQSQGFSILSGNCLYELLTPYMPIFDALKSNNLDYLFTEEAPKIEAIYLITNSGLLIKEIKRKETKLNPTIFASMFTTVCNFIQESLSMLSGEDKEGTLNALGFENYRILIESGKNANLVVILSGKENEFLINDAREIQQKIEKEYGSIITDWDGDYKKFEGIEETLQSLITSGKYDGIYYGKESPKARRNLLFENVSLGLLRQTKIKPVLLCIEDLQWADSSTLALMHYIARTTKDSKLFIVGTYRPEDVAVMDLKEHPLITTMQLMDHEELHKKIDLKRLPRQSIDEFLDSLLGKNDLNDEIINRIFKETEGNPLFIIQLVKFLVEEKILQTEDDIWKLTINLEDINIPTKVYNVIKRRLDRVEKEYRKVLDYASVIGETFSSNTLAQALNVERVRILEQLREIEHKHRLILPQNGNYKFDHAKIKDVLYDMTPPELRKEYHATIANAMEAWYGSHIETVIEDLAFHYYQCRDGEKALKFLLKAAHKAKRDYSNEESIRFYSKALEFIEDPSERISILEEIGHTCDIIGNYSGSLEAYNEALELATDSDKKALLMSKIGNTYGFKGEFETGLTTCDAALELIKGQGAISEGSVLSVMGALHERKCENETALEYLKKSLEIFQRIDDQRSLANCLNTIGFSTHWLGRFETSIEYLKQALQIWEELEDQEGILQCNLLIGTSYSRLGELDVSLEHLKKALESSDRVGDQKARIRCLGEIGLVHLERAEYEEAYEMYTIGGRIADKTDDKWAIAACYSTRCLIDAWTGNCEKALENLDEPHGIVEAIDYKRGIAMNYVIYGECYIHRGDLEKAQFYCDKAMALFKEYVVNELSWGTRLQAKIYQAQKKWPEAIEMFQKAIDFCIEKSIKGAELGRGYYDFAMMWKNKGDLKETRENLLKAREIYVHFKASKKVNEIDAMLKALPN